MGNTVLVRQMVQENPEYLHVEQQGRTPLYYACHGGHYKVVELLLQAGATDDALRTCYQSSLNQKIRQLLQQYRAVDSVLELQRKVAASHLDGPTPTCSSSSSSSSGCCDYTEDGDESQNKNDMYLHLFDTIEATCSHSEDNNHNNISSSSKNDTVKSTFHRCFPSEFESAPPPTSYRTDDPTIDCSDSLLTELANNHSVPVVRHRSTTTSKIQPHHPMLPSFMCCREASLIDSDAMEDEMWNHECDSNIDGTEDGVATHSNTTPPTMMSTLTIETTARKIEVQETMYHPQNVLNSTTSSSTLKDRILQRITLRRKNHVNNTTSKQSIDYKEIPKEHTKSSVMVPLLRPRSSVIFGGRRKMNPVDDTVTDGENSDNHNEIIETSTNGESEVVLCNTASDRNVTVSDNDLIDILSPVLDNLEPNTEEDAIEMSTFVLDDNAKIHDDTMTTGTISGVATTVELSLVQAAALQLSQQPSTYSTNSFWSYDTYTSTDDIKKVMIPIITVPVPFDNSSDTEKLLANGISPSVSGKWTNSFSGSRSHVSLPQDQLHIRDGENENTDISIAENNDNQRTIKESSRTDFNSKADTSTVVNGEITSSIVEQHDQIPLQRTVHRSSTFIDTTGQRLPGTPRSFLDSTMEAFGCLPDDADDTFTLQSMSFDNQIQSMDRHTSILSESSDSKPTFSEQSQSKLDRNLTSRVNKLIYATSPSLAPNSIDSERSGRSSVLIVPQIVTTPSPLTSKSTCSNSHQNYSNHCHNGTDAVSVTDDDCDATSTSQSVDEHGRDHHHHHSIYSTSSCDDSFYDDHDDDDNTLDQMMEDDEISSPDVTSIFCR